MPTTLASPVSHGRDIRCGFAGLAIAAVMRTHRSFPDSFGTEYARWGTVVRFVGCTGSNGVCGSASTCDRGIVLRSVPVHRVQGASKLNALARLSLLYIHVVAFAVALGCVLREDTKLVSRWPLDLHSLREASRIVATALAVLWASGLAIIMFDSGGAILSAGSNAKLLAKIIIVLALTLNGLALHWIAFPHLRNPPPAIASAAYLGAGIVRAQEQQQLRMR